MSKGMIPEEIKDNLNAEHIAEIIEANITDIRLRDYGRETRGAELYFGDKYIFVEFDKGGNIDITVFAREANGESKT